MPISKTKTKNKRSYFNFTTLFHTHSLYLRVFSKILPKMSENKQSYAPKVRPNYIYSILSVALVLFLLGFFGLMLIQTKNLVDVFKERVNIMVELEEGAEQASIDKIRELISTSAYARPESISFTSKEDAVELLREDFGEDFLNLDLPNPLYDVLTFNVHSNYLVADSLQDIRKSLKRYSFVSDVYYQESLINEIATNIERVGYLALLISLFFILVAVLLIHNTIRLALYSNRFLIKNMQLVGASWGFISKPYLMRSLWQGVFSAILAIAALLLISFLINQEISTYVQFGQNWRVWMLFLGMLLLGILITTASTYYAVNKYLKMRTDDLY